MGEGRARQGGTVPTSVSQELTKLEQKEDGVGRAKRGWVVLFVVVGGDDDNDDDDDDDG